MHLPIHKEFTKSLVRELNKCSDQGIEDAMIKVRKIFKVLPNKKIIHDCYSALVEKNEIQRACALEKAFKKPVRSWSGVLVVTVVLRPDRFSCTYNCKYCPDEKKQNGSQYDMPRSYLSSEPAVMRAKSVEFDIVKQFHSRLDTLRDNGHVIDKIEVIVLGGTFSIYPREYQNDAMRDIFFAANVYRKSIRQKNSLHVEQHYNETGTIKVIGISVETRPDHISIQELKRFRFLGITRVQIGVQHTNDDILKIIDRRHDTKSSISAIALLKNFGFKVDIHLMPDLPGSNQQMDKMMFERVFLSGEFKPDYLKIYPCLDVKYTEIRRWKAQGIWKPYAESDPESLIQLLLYVKTQLVQKYVRLNRIQRDFPKEHMNNGFNGFLSNTLESNFRQVLHQRMRSENKSCPCIRCREIKDHKFAFKNICFMNDTYEASGGKEFFISFDDSSSDKLIGFARLRLAAKNMEHSTKNLRGCALIRELHVYGSIQRVLSKNNCELPQHNGIGKCLIARAELVSLCHGFKKIAVISGVGVREYYKKQGYTLIETYMVKDLNIFTAMINLWDIFQFFMTVLMAKFKLI